VLRLWLPCLAPGGAALQPPLWPCDPGRAAEPLPINNTPSAGAAGYKRDPAF